MLTYRARFWILMAGSLVFWGCQQSSPTKPDAAATGSTTKPDNSTDKTGSSKPKPGAPAGYWEDYPDVPKVEIMTEVDGIKIPRIPASKANIDLNEPILADVGNDWALRKPCEPVTGDTLTIRFSSEPKVMNPITENSAVNHILLKYIYEDLAKQNLETFEFEPKIAKSWVFEDSVKLAANYPGRERRVEIVDGATNLQPGTDTPTFEYQAPPAADDKPPDGPKVTLKTTDKDGQPRGHVWVGIYPVGKIPGASAEGFHEWSDDNGELKVSGIPAGKYTVKTGDEVFGQAEQLDDGSLKVTPKTEENPLKEPLLLKQHEWQSIHSRTYATFNLRDDVKWSDGTPYTTKDLEFGYALLSNPYVDGDSIRIYYKDLVECTALGPHKIRFRNRQQYFKGNEIFFEFAELAPPFHFFEKLQRDLGRELVLVPLAPGEDGKNRISARGQEFGKFFNTEERYNSKPLGTGPYIVDKWERKDRVELVRNPNYWDTGKSGYLDRIIVKFIPDQVTAFSALKAGEIDFLYRMSVDQFFDDWPLVDAETRQMHVKGSWFSPVFAYVAWNQLAPQFQDRRVRLALTLLFDRQDFINKKLHGTSMLVSGTQYLFGPGYDHEVDPIGYDPQKARDLLSEAGWIDTDNDGILDRNGVKFQVTLRTAKGSPINEAMCEVIQKNLKDVGIELQIQTMEWASFVEKLRSKECDVVTLSWTLPLESDPYQIWHSSGATRENRGSNTVSFRNKLADELIDLLRVTLDEKKRFRIHQSFHRLLDSEQPYMFLWMPKEFGVYHRRFRNVKWYRLRPGFDLSEWYVPKDEQLHK